MPTILHISCSERGGAGSAATRLHRGLLEEGVASLMLVQHTNSGSDERVFGARSPGSHFIQRVRPRLDGLPLLFYPSRLDVPWSVSWLPSTLQRTLDKIRPQIVHLHWFNHGFIGLRDLRSIHCPIIWTLHDMWPFTGGCHYSGSCDKYLAACGACPQLSSKHCRDLSRWELNAKTRLWKDLNLTLVSPSQWLANCARESSLFRSRELHVIPNGIDLSSFLPVDRQMARETLGLPLDKCLVLCGAGPKSPEARKGGKHLQEAMAILGGQQLNDSFQLVTFGAGAGTSADFHPFYTHSLGVLRDEASLALLYSACDIFVAPSLADNLPNTVMEATACGTPTVAFQVGGIPEMIEHGHTGYLVQGLDCAGLAHAIKSLVTDPARRQHFSRHARQKATEEFSHRLQARRYHDVYAKMIGWLPNNQAGSRPHPSTLTEPLHT